MSLIASVVPVGLLPANMSPVWTETTVPSSVPKPSIPFLLKRTQVVMESLKYGVDFVDSETGAGADCPF